MARGNLRSRFAQALGAVALLGAGYGLGQMGGTPLAAQQGNRPPAVVTAPAPAQPAAPPKDQRVVAYVHGKTALTREELGEYLIQRYGRDRIELFVNTRIIEMACAAKGIDATPHEVEAQILDDCKVVGISLQDFDKHVLKKYGKTMYEWKEDVIRPRIMLAKLCRDRIQVNDEDLKKTFENRYGKKVKAKVIIWPKGRERDAQRVYGEISKDDLAFNRVARAQPDPTLAPREGLVEPISRWSITGDNTIEDEAFKLQEGEVSRLIDTPVGTVVVKCLGFVEPRKDVNFEQVKPELIKEAIDKKITVEVPKLCEQLKAQAAPVYILQPANVKTADQDRQAQQLIKETEGAGPTTRQ